MMQMVWNKRWDVLVLAGLGLVSFHSDWHGAIFWIYAEHRVDTIEVFVLLQSRACTEPKPLLLFVLPR